MGRKLKKKNIKFTPRCAAQDLSQPSTGSLASRSRQQSPSSSNDSSETDDDYVPSSLSSSSRNQGRSSEQSQEEIAAAGESQLVSDCVFYLLVADQRKYAIKKADIVKHVLKQHRKQYKMVMEKVEAYLKKVFGYDLIEIENTKGQYILVNRMKGAEVFVEISKDEKAKFGLTMVVLAIIFMSEDYVLESDMWNALGKLGVDRDTKHPVFGDVKRLLTQELVRQMYIEYKKENSDPPAFVFSWGARAQFEVSKLEILKFVCEVYGDNITPQMWPTQYKNATSSDQTAD